MPLQPDNFVPSRKRHQMTESFRRNNVAITHEFRNRFS